MGDGALRRCVGDAGQFTRRHWARAPLYRPRADRAAFADLFSLADVDHILSATEPRLPAFRLVKDGRPLDPATYTKSGRMGSRPVRDLADPGRVYAAFEGGATIVLQSLHRYWLPLGRFCRELELSLTHPVQANAYITPPASRGLGVHADGHDVFVLQLHGRKQWEVYRPAGTAPGERLVGATLSPGDCLYVPRGFPHAARTADAASVHLTVGVLAYRWEEVLRDAVAEVLADQAFAEPLPVGFADHPEALVARVAEQLDELAGRLGKLDPARVADAARRRFLASRPPLLTGQLQQLLALDTVTDATVVRRRPGSVCQLAAGGGELTVLLGDRQLVLPAHLEPALRAILAADRFTVGALAGQLDEASRLVLVRRLIREGMLESVPVA